jgi:hemerythrin
MDIQWTPDLEVGVELIDNQHKELFVRYNNLIQALWDAKPREEVAKFLDFLGVYVEEHFAAEEAFMEHHGYSHYPTHKAQHISFVEDLEKLKADLEAKDMSSETTINLINETYNWLRNHIRGTDQQLGAFLQGKL